MRKPDHADSALRSAVDAVGVRAIKDARDCRHKVQALFLTFVNTAAFERLERTKAKLSKALGDGYFKTHAPGEAIELLDEHLEAFHGFPRDDPDYQTINTEIFTHARRALVLAVRTRFPDEKLDRLGYGALLEMIKLAEHYLLSMNFDLTKRLSSHHWTIEPF